MNDPAGSEKPSLFERLNKLWMPAAIAAWGGALLVLACRTLLSPERATNTARYLRAGERWFDGLPLYIYTPNKGFVYSPFSAVCYALTSVLPHVLANILWILISAGLLLAGFWVLMSKGPFSHVPVRLRGLAFLLVFPLSLGNLDSAQANPLVIGFIMIAIAAACVERWTLAAVAIAGAFYWKVYPLAVGMLLILLAPRKFTWRLVLALVVMALIPFLFQNPSYVADQYRLWVDTRMADNRLEYSLNVAPLDLWFVLVRMGGLPLSDELYRGLQLAAGAAIAGFCLYGRLKRWPNERLLAGLFSLVCVWMALLGPASELHTYLLLAPAVALGVVESFSGGVKPLPRVLAVAAYVCLLLAILRVGFIPHYKNAYVLALQPVGAMVFLAYVLMRYLDDAQWKGGGSAGRLGASSLPSNRQGPTARLSDVSCSCRFAGDRAPAGICDDSIP